MVLRLFQSIEVLKLHPRAMLAYIAGQPVLSILYSASLLGND